MERVNKNRARPDWKKKVPKNKIKVSKHAKSTSKSYSTLT